MDGQTIVCHASALGGGELLLANLTNCNVYVLGAIDALWMYHMVDCRVYGGPVQGATFVNGAQFLVVVFFSPRVGHCA